MKKLFALLAVVLAVVSCQKDVDNLDVNIGGDVATISVTLPADAITRAVGGTDSSLGGLANTAGETIRVILKIYDEEGNPSDQRQVKYLSEDQLTTNFDVRLIPDREYTFVAWADKVDGEADVDKFYNTTDLKNVTLIDNTWEAMNEGRDAFTATHTESNFTSVSNITLELKRPLAKLRVVTTDMEALRYWRTEPTTATVSYTTPHYTGFNAYEGKAINRDNVNVEHQNYTIHTYTNEHKQNVKTLFTDYFFAAEGQETIQFNIAVSDKNSRLIREVAFNTEIPVKRNNLTTIQGNILTDGDKINVVINPNFDNGSDWNPNEDNKDIKAISSNAEFAAAMTGGSGKYIVVSDNIVISASAKTLAATRGGQGSNGKVINIDLNGKTIIIENNDTTKALFDLDDNDALIFSGEGTIEGTGNGKLVDGGTVVVTGEAEVYEDAVADNVVIGVKALEYIVANGGEFTFTADIEVTSKKILSITADNVVINGNGFAFTSNAPRAINVDGADGVVIKNLNIVASGERAINLINGGTNVTVENVTAKAANYTFNVAGSSAGAVAIIKNSDLTGMNTVNIAAENTNVTITNTKLTTVDNTEVENYATIAVNKYAEGSKVAVNGGEVVITGTHCDGCKVASVGSDNSEVTFDGTVGATNDDVVIIYFATIYSDGTYYGHATLDEAIAQSEEDNGSVITLIRNYTTSEPLIIANDKSLTLDLNGKTISSVDKNVEMSSKGNFYLIDNRGTLTIKDSSADKTGAIILSAETDREWTASSVVVANNNGNLTIEGGRIEHLGGTSMAYGVDNLTNGNLGEATCTINGGHIKSTYRAVRQFLNSATDMNILTVNGGIIEGANKSIWMQDPSKKANLGTLVVENGATLNGDVYLYVTEGSTEWPVEVTIADSALAGESKITSKNVPECYGVVLDENGNWVVESYTMVTDGLFKDDKGAYVVTNAEGLATLNAKMANRTAGKGIVVNINADIDFTGKTWTPVDSHVDFGCYISKLNGNGHTISNLTINGQAMFTRFAGSGDVIIKDITFDAANVNSNGKINTSILTVQSYQKVTLDNVDVKNSTICGGYKVAPLIATVYNENPSTVTAILKNCDVENTTVKATSLDFCTTGMVAFVYAGNNDAITFENCTVSNVKLYAPNAYTAHAAVYTTGSETLYNEVEGVTVTNVTFENI